MIEEEMSDYQPVTILDLPRFTGGGVGFVGSAWSMVYFCSGWFCTAFNEGEMARSVAGFSESNVVGVLHFFPDDRDECRKRIDAR